MRGVRVTIVTVKSSKSYIFCVSATLFIPHAMHIRRIILSSVTCLDLPHFSALCHKEHDFPTPTPSATKKKWTNNTFEHKMCILFLSTTFVWKSLILITIQQDSITNVDRSSCKILDILFKILIKIEPPPPQKKRTKNTFEHKMCILVCLRKCDSNNNSARYHHKCRLEFL